MIVNYSFNDKQRHLNSFIQLMGNITGSVIPSITFFLVVSDLYSIPTWQLFFIIITASIFPLIFISLILKEDIEEIKIQNEQKVGLIEKKTIILLGCIYFLYYSVKIYEYPLEP